MENYSVKLLKQYVSPKWGKDIRYYEGRARILFDEGYHNNCMVGLTTSFLIEMVDLRMEWLLRASEEERKIQNVNCVIVAGPALPGEPSPFLQKATVGNHIFHPREYEGSTIWHDEFCDIRLKAFPSKDKFMNFKLNNPQDEPLLSLGCPKKPWDLPKTKSDELGSNLIDCGIFDLFKPLQQRLVAINYGNDLENLNPPGKTATPGQYKPKTPGNNNKMKTEDMREARLKRQQAQQKDYLRSFMGGMVPQEGKDELFLKTVMQIRGGNQGAASSEQQATTVRKLVLPKLPNYAAVKQRMQNTRFVREKVRGVFYKADGFNRELENIAVIIYDMAVDLNGGSSYEKYYASRSAGQHEMINQLMDELECLYIQISKGLHHKYKRPLKVQSLKTKSDRSRSYKREVSRADSTGVRIMIQSNRTCEPFSDTRKIFMTMLILLQFIRAYIYDDKLFLRLIFYISANHVDEEFSYDSFKYYVNGIVVRHRINPTIHGFPYLTGTKGRGWGSFRIQYTTAFGNPYEVNYLHAPEQGVPLMSFKPATDRTFVGPKAKSIILVEHDGGAERVNTAIINMKLDEEFIVISSNGRSGNNIKILLKSLADEHNLPIINIGDYNFHGMLYLFEIY